MIRPSPVPRYHSRMPDQEIEAADAVNATTATRVAAELRRRILHGQLEPGSRLKLEELASQLDVSHMPVREALRELEGEGLLELYPHRGAVIKGVDAPFVRNLYDVRGAIEGMVADQVVEILGRDQAAVEEWVAANA